MSKIIAIDIGGSKIMTALVEITKGPEGLEGELTGIVKEPLYIHSRPEDIMLAIERMIQRTFQETQANWSEIERIGVTIPGIADAEHGYWIYAPFSGIRDFPIADQLKEYYHHPVFADNDVNACAWAEKVFGVCRDINDFLWITISNGIGGGLVLNGEVYAGAFGRAAEFGHLCIVEDGHLCGCGNRGCMEAEAAGPGIARRFKEGLTLNREAALLWRGREITAESIARSARGGDPLAIQVYETTGHYLGRAAAWAANLINPAKIVFGGGVSGSFDLFYPSMIATFEKQAFQGRENRIVLVKTGLGYEAGLYAAAALTVNNNHNNNNK